MRRRVSAVFWRKRGDLASIEAFYFAQSELPSNMLPAKISSEWMLADIEGIVVKLPLVNQDELKELELSTIKPSQRSIKIERFAAPIAKKTLSGVF